MDDMTDFRAEVRAWFDAHAPHDWKLALPNMNNAEYGDFQCKWLRTLGTRGFAAPHVPVEWGGGGYDVHRQAVIYEEWTRADAPALNLYPVSLFHVPGTILAVGTSWQKDTFVRAAVDGTVWCQGFSEPGAGSDLAALRTRADRVEGGWRVTGQKIWSSNADLADHCLLLARTDPEATRSQGISYFIMDMHQQGVEVRPIRQSTGHEEFCEIFLDGAWIPEAYLLGEENRGWQVAQGTLATERGPVGLEIIERTRTSLIELGAALGDDDTGRAAVVRQELARLTAHAEAVRAFAADMVDGAARGDASFGSASLLKIAFSELLRDMTGYASLISGLSGLVDPGQRHQVGFVSGDWTIDWLGSWGWTIAAGTSEVQRNIVAEQVLGLPRESRPGAQMGVNR